MGERKYLVSNYRKDFTSPNIHTIFHTKYSTRTADHRVLKCFNVRATKADNRRHCVLSWHKNSKSRLLHLPIAPLGKPITNHLSDILYTGCRRNFFKQAPRD
uniref:Uncharacterized protein n=1 Tax=Cacopsylla melanoneura TaxID=428564 RepID=A0A8D9BLW6_9HEMI